MNRNFLLPIVVAMLSIIGPNLAVALLVPNKADGFPLFALSILVITPIYGMVAKERFRQSLIIVGAGFTAATLLIWLASFFIGSHYADPWTMIGLGSGYLLAGGLLSAIARISFSRRS